MSFLDCFDYDAETGQIKWSGLCQHAHSAKTQKGYYIRGYLHICLEGKNYPIHRLAFLKTGVEIGNLWVDHINGLRDDNRLCNLRLVTPAQNQWNSKIRKGSSSGVKGVSFLKASNSWVARIKKHGLIAYQENFKTFEEACEASIRHRAIHHGEFARHE